MMISNRTVNLNNFKSLIQKAIGSWQNQNSGNSFIRVAQKKINKRI